MWGKVVLTGKLNAKRVASETRVGRHGDGGGLYLVVNEGGSRQWILRTVIQGRRRDIGLGGAGYISLAEAREKARRLRTIARQGGDPLAETRRATLTFEQAARRVFEMNRPTWKNGKHVEQWIRTMEIYVFPHFGHRYIEQLGSTDVLHALTPIWTAKPETARRVCQRIATVFDWAKGAGYYAGENPVNGVRRALPRVRSAPQHLAALPWREVPDFVSDLHDRTGVAALCLEFVILTAVRSGEARGARWEEIFDGVWTIPPERMKTGRAHRVPLSEQALSVLGRARMLDGEHVFPGQKPGRPLSVMAFAPVIRRMGYDGITVHGFRSAFRDWCSEYAHAPREVAEAALAHRLGDAVEQAYSRSDMFARRTGLMAAWGSFVDGVSGARVISLPAAGL